MNSWSVWTCDHMVHELLSLACLFWKSFKDVSWVMLSHCSHCKGLLRDSLARSLPSHNASQYVLMDCGLVATLSGQANLNVRSRWRKSIKRSHLQNNHVSYGCWLLSRVPTLCNPMGCSLPGFSVHGILQTRTLEWVAISFSNAR